MQLLKKVYRRHKTHTIDEKISILRTVFKLFLSIEITLLFNKLKTNRLVVVWSITNYFLFLNDSILNSIPPYVYPKIYVIFVIYLLITFQSAIVTVILDSYQYIIQTLNMNPNHNKPMFYGYKWTHLIALITLISFFIDQYISKL